MSLKRFDETPFTTGTARFADNVGELNRTPRIWLTVRVANQLKVEAMVDTGAAWSILRAELADELGMFDLPGEDDVSLRTAMGPVTGRLVQTSIEILASAGASCRVECTVFVSRDWSGEGCPNFIGYQGFLDRMRFAVDAVEGRNEFHFAPGN